MLFHLPDNCFSQEEEEGEKEIITTTNHYFFKEILFNNLKTHQFSDISIYPIFTEVVRYFKSVASNDETILDKLEILTGKPRSVFVDLLNFKLDRSDQTALICGSFLFNIYSCLPSKQIKQIIEGDLDTLKNPLLKYNIVNKRAFVKGDDVRFRTDGIISVDFNNNEFGFYTVCLLVLIPKVEHLSVIFQKEIKEGYLRIEGVNSGWRYY
ncbi:hypothetical protein ABK040_016901 [Willaertia magna]